MISMFGCSGMYTKCRSFLVNNFIKWCLFVNAFGCELLIALAVPPAFHALTDVPKSTGFLARIFRFQPCSVFRPTQRHGRFETRLGACGGEEEGPDLRCKEGWEGRQCSAPIWCRGGNHQEMYNPVTLLFCLSPAAFRFGLSCISHEWDPLCRSIIPHIPICSFLWALAVRTYWTCLWQSQGFPGNLSVTNCHSCSLLGEATANGFPQVLGYGTDCMYNADCVQTMLDPTRQPPAQLVWTRKGSMTRPMF